MPRFLPLAFMRVSAWPRLAEGVYSDTPYDEGQVAYPEGGGVVAEYLHSLAIWQLFGLVCDPLERAEIRELWKRRLDLRGVLCEAIGDYVCDEFERPFLRHVLAGGRGAVRRWVAAYPTLRTPLLEHYRERTRRYKDPFTVISACRVLTRELDEPPEVWRAAALAIHHDDRRQARRPPDRRSDFLRHDLEDHGTVSRKEGDLINHYLDELGGDRVEVMSYGAWWHPQPVPHGSILARLASASHALAGERWGDADEQRYAEILARLTPGEAASFTTDLDFLRRIADAARERSGPPT
jgi:hypothetical protein